jgi:hypothetical protein
MWLPAASAPCPGITLSDASEPGERAHSRRSAWTEGCTTLVVWGAQNWSIWR